MKQDMILILDLGSEENPRLAREIRAMGVYTEIHPHDISAQELAAHGYALYYFNSKKQGELDFVIEHEGNVLPLEIKSGKDYTRHNALSGVMANPDYHIPAAFVFHSGNVSVKEKITYYPIYMMMFLREPELAQDLTYTPDFGVLMG